jgi:hypothetical protein
MQRSGDAGSNFRPDARLELGLLVRHIYLLQGAKSHKCQKTDPIEKSINT